MSHADRGAQRTATSAPRVFVSYSHDSEQHRLSVVELTTILRGFGVDARIDRFSETPPPRSWAAWMHDEIEAADFVLVVCTETYSRRATNREAPGIGLGARWEGAILTQEAYELADERFIPVLLEHSAKAHIPYFLRGTTFYVIDVETHGGIEPLLRHIFNDPEILPAALGARPTFPLTPDMSVAKSEAPTDPNAGTWSGDLIKAADALLVAWDDVRGGGQFDIALLGLREALDCFARAMSERVGAPCRATVKGVYQDTVQSEFGKYPGLWVRRIATSSSTEVSARPDSSPLFDNLDFGTSYERGMSVVFDNDSQYLAHYTNRVFLPQKHAASIVWPLSLIKPGKRFNLIGYLCLDSSMSGVFLAERDVPVGYLFASIITGFLLEAFTSYDPRNSDRDEVGES